MVDEKQWYYDAIKEVCSKWDNVDINVTIGMETYTFQQCIANIMRRTEKPYAECCNDIANTLISKCKDYTAIGSSPFSNFEKYAQVGVSVEWGIKTRIVDKVSRLKGLIANWYTMGEVKDEAIEDSWRDLAGYICILYIYKHQELWHEMKYITEWENS